PASGWIMALLMPRYMPEVHPKTVVNSERKLREIHHSIQSKGEVFRPQPMTTMTTGPSERELLVAVNDPLLGILDVLELFEPTLGNLTVVVQPKGTAVKLLVHVQQQFHSSSRTILLAALGSCCFTLGSKPVTTQHRREPPKT